MSEDKSSKISPETKYKEIVEAAESLTTSAETRNKEIVEPVESLTTSAETHYKETVEAVKNGDNKAKTKLAYYKLSGYGGCEIDVDEVVVLLKERVKDKDTEAMWLLGLCYEYGMGCEQDLKRADSLYKQSYDGRSDIGEFFVLNGKDKRGTGIMNVWSL